MLQAQQLSELQDFAEAERSTLLEKLAELEEGLEQARRQVAAAEQQRDEAHQQLQQLQLQQAAALKQVRAVWWQLAAACAMGRPVAILRDNASTMAPCMLFPMCLRLGYRQCLCRHCCNTGRADMRRFLLLQVEQLSAEQLQLCRSAEEQASALDSLQAQVEQLQVQRDQALERSRRTSSDLDAALSSSHRMIKQVRMVHA